MTSVSGHDGRRNSDPPQVKRLVTSWTALSRLPADVALVRSEAADECASS